MKIMGGWYVHSVYPPGFQIPSSGMPAEPHFEKSLSEALSHIKKFHSDDEVPGGTQPSADPTGGQPEPYAEGTAIWLHRKSNGWMPVTRFPGGGISQRMATYSTLQDAFEGQRLLYGEQ
jgi:hypothetical protein